MFVHIVARAAQALTFYPGHSTIVRVKTFVRQIAVRFRVIKELFAFLWHTKQWWLIPLVVVLLVFGLLIALAAPSVVAPFIYTLF